jgi:carbamoyltransferase
MNILGINIFHGDASAALIVNGQLVAAVEEERFNRIKHWAGFPAESIKCCLNLGNIHPTDLDAVAVSFNPKANFLRRTAHAIKIALKQQDLGGRLQRIQKVKQIPQLIAQATGVNLRDCKFKVFPVEHHETHIAAGYWTSPFPDAAILSIDGMGDFVSTVLADAQGCHWKRIHQVFFPHSLGFLYNAITLFLGFPNYGDEYKVMGLAPYGTPRFLDLFRKIIYRHQLGFKLNLNYFTHAHSGIRMTWDNGNPIIAPFHSKLLEAELGPMRAKNEPLTDHHQDIAASLQAVTEEIILSMLNDLHRITQKKNLCITGGVAMNSVANGKVRAHTPFENVFVPVGAADNGTAVGAAFVLWKKLNGSRTFKLEHGYWGHDVDLQQSRIACEKRNIAYSEYSPEIINEKIVDAIIDGKVVGVFRGRMEFGARALGNRSLIADPRRTDMRDLINLKIKFREKFRPFAPSILEEYVQDYFELPEPSPFMEKVLKVRPEMQAKIPAVTHVDGTGRLQTVSKKTNPLYWDLIERFRQRTQIPIVLNTSLNENEPIVNTPDEALSCFLRTKMDAIVIGNLWVERKTS